MSFSNVKALPFVGTKYGIEKAWGLSVLLLGESTYTKDGEPLTPEITVDLVEDQIDGFAYSFYTRVVGVFHGHWPDQATRCEFWRSVAFYNFIQESVGPKARWRPSADQWQRSIPAFEEVLAELRPDFILVLGKQLWDNLLAPHVCGPSVTLPDGTSRESRLYGNAFAFSINHPSSVGWSYEEWTPWVKAAVVEAVRHRTGVPLDDSEGPS